MSSVETQDLLYGNTRPHVRMWGNGVGDYGGKKEWCKRPHLLSCCDSWSWCCKYLSLYQHIKLAQKVHSSFKKLYKFPTPVIVGKALTDNPSSRHQLKPHIWGICLFPCPVHTHLPPKCHATPAGGAMGAYEKRPPSPPALPVPLPQPRAANYLETHIWLRAGGNSKAVKLEKKKRRKKSSLWSVCDLRVPKGSFCRIISPGNFTREGFCRKRHVSDIMVSPLLNSKSLL